MGKSPESSEPKAGTCPQKLRRSLSRHAKCYGKRVRRPCRTICRSIRPSPVAMDIGGMFSPVDDSNAHGPRQSFANLPVPTGTPPPRAPKANAPERAAPGQMNIQQRTGRASPSAEAVAGKVPPPRPSTSDVIAPRPPWIQGFWFPPGLLRWAREGQLRLASIVFLVTHSEAASGVWPASDMPEFVDGRRSRGPLMS